jgi:two-component system response regulator
MPRRNLDGDRPKEVLLLEHNNADACLIRLAFDKTLVSYNMHIVADADAALRHLYAGNPSSRPDLIVIDLDLPRTDALGLLKRIKSHAVTGITPIDVMSTSASESEVLRAYDLNANCYVNKAVNAEDFYRTLTSLATFWLSVVELPSYCSKIWAHNEWLP